MKIRVALDIAELGSYGLAGERGVRRVVENFALGLLRDPRVDLQFTGLSRGDAVSAPRAEQEQRSTAFSATPPFIDRLARDSVRFVSRTAADRALHLRAVRWSMLKLHRLVAASSRRLPYRSLEQAEIVHCTFRPVPHRLRSRRRQGPAAFITIYDLIPLLWPELTDDRTVRLIRSMADSIGDNVWITCISHAVKRDICEVLKIESDRIFVTPLAASKTVFHQATGAALEATLERYGLRDCPYILSLSAIDHRKNLVHLLDSFARLAQNPSAGEVKLVLVGQYWPNQQEFITLTSRHPSIANRLVFTGFVPNTDLAAIYSGALAFAFPSLAEGFGLPPLEAMQCGTPVICSNATSLPEVVGDAAILLDPHDQEAWCDAMLRLCSDETLRAELQERSLRRAEQFTWEKTTDALVAAYEHAIASRQ